MSTKYYESSGAKSEDDIEDESPDPEDESSREDFMNGCMQKMNKKGVNAKDARQMCMNMWTKSGGDKAKAQIIFHLLDTNK
jgi:hypothetical protein